MDMVRRLAICLITLAVYSGCTRAVPPAQEGLANVRAQIIAYAASPARLEPSDAAGFAKAFDLKLNPRTPGRPLLIGNRAIGGDLLLVGTWLRPSGSFPAIAELMVFDRTQPASPPVCSWSAAEVGKELVAKGYAGHSPQPFQRGWSQTFWRTSSDGKTLSQVLLLGAYENGDAHRPDCAHGVRFMDGEAQ